MQSEQSFPNSNIANNESRTSIVDSTSPTINRKSEVFRSTRSLFSSVNKISKIKSANVSKNESVIRSFPSSPNMSIPQPSTELLLSPIQISKVTVYLSFAYVKVESPSISMSPTKPMATDVSKSSILSFSYDNFLKQGDIINKSLSVAPVVSPTKKKVCSPCL